MNDSDEKANRCGWGLRLRTHFERRFAAINPPAGWRRAIEPHWDCAPAIFYYPPSQVGDAAPEPKLRIAPDGVDFFGMDHPAARVDRVPCEIWRVLALDVDLSAKFLRDFCKAHEHRCGQISLI